MKVFVLFAFLFASYSVYACPNFSGTYNQVMQQGDSRSTIIWTIRQNGCDRFDNETQVIYKDGSKSDTVQFNRTIDGVNQYWDGSKLIDFQKDATTEHCDIRGSLEQDQKNNLRYSWRFECPPPRGTSPWFTPETPSGWAGELYIKK